ncbi:MAG: RluA family pseudouridine synthase [Polaribacter sp.]|uniref:RluA family pseudouridine synthase n=1 Tax=Polaribacter sp. TaxID=1920175 RepID=UPI00321B72BB
MQLLETYIAKKQEKSIRFQEYGVGIFNTVSTKSAIKKAIKKELIFIDGILATTSKFISGGEKIELYQSEKNSSFKRLKLDLEVLYEDDFLAIVNKPAGVLVSGNKFVTITNALPQNLQKSTQKDAVKPQPIHRLDYPTSGLLLVGKTSSAIQRLSLLFKKKQIQKTYYAITIGSMCDAAIIHFKVNNKNASTKFKVLQSVKSERFKYLNLVELQPKTGRKHQLRKHLSSIGHQILGDTIYGKSDLILKGKGLYLHASKLEFEHPITSENIIIFKEFPKKFTRIFKHIKTN